MPTRKLVVPSEPQALVGLTPALEDYLETIYLFTRERPVARIKDIALAREVRSASVSPAMRRLEELGFVKYERREFIELTERGEEAARRVFSRHRVLSSFFADVLHMPEDEAYEEACVMEHHLSDKAMDRLVRFFEFLRTCPDAPLEVLARFHRCGRIQEGKATCDKACARANENGDKTRQRTLADLALGQEATVIQIKAHPSVRQRLLDMGVLPGTKVKLERKAPSGDPLWVRAESAQIALRRSEAEGVLVELPSG